MSDTLTESLKEAMGYTNDAPKYCSECAYSILKDNPNLDRDWITWCTYNKIRQFSVCSKARCRFWESKVKK